MSEELKPCPFCGNTPKVEITNPGSLIYQPRIYLSCPECGVDSMIPTNWNTRPAEDALKAEVERLKADNERLKKGVGKD